MKFQAIYVPVKPRTFQLIISKFKLPNFECPYFNTFKNSSYLKIVSITYSYFVIIYRLVLNKIILFLAFLCVLMIMQYFIDFTIIFVAQFVCLFICLSPFLLNVFKTMDIVKMGLFCRNGHYYSPMIISLIIKFIQLQ